MDGVSAETGQLSGFTTRVKEVDSECEAMHWVIHREMLARRKMSLELNILQNVMKIINYIEIRAFNSRLLMQLYEEIDAEHTHLFLYTKVRWLSKGRSLARVFFLKLDDNYLTTLCLFLLYHNMNQLWVYMYPLPWEPPSHCTPTALGHRWTLSWAPRASSQWLSVYTWCCMYASPTLSFAPLSTCLFSVSVSLFLPCK